MEQLFLQLIFNWRFNVLVSALALSIYLVNYCALKLKREYTGIHWQMFLVISLVPGFNLIFLIFNSILFFTRSTGYKVVKVKKRSNARTGKTVKA